MSANVNLDAKAILPMLAKAGQSIKPYVGVMFFLFFAVVYGFIVSQINKYSAPVVDETEVISEAKSSPTPRIDKDAAAKLESLEDNSVNVQTLFEEGRTNPFEE